MQGFLTDIEIAGKISKGDLIDKEYDENCLDTIMYDLRLGKENYVTPKGQINLKEKKDYLTIEPGQTAILTTLEHIKMPNNVFGLITIKFSHKGKGLINISGFHVDPGFCGHLIFSVYNAGKKSISFHFKDKVFSIIFYQLHREVESDVTPFEHIPTWIIEHYEGAFFPSILEIEKQVRDNSMYIKILFGFLSGLLLAFLNNILHIFDIFV